MSATPVRQSTAHEDTIGPVLDADGVAVTDCVIGDFKIKKTTGNYAALNGSATLAHVSAGMYDIVLTTSDLDTVGRATVAIDDTVNACAPLRLQVIEEAVYDALYAASANAWSGAAGSSIGVANMTQIGGDAQSATDLKDFADAGYDPATNKVQGVVLVDTLTTYTGNTPQTADHTASVAAILADTNEVQVSLAAGGLIESMVDDLQTEVDGIQADTEDIQSRLPAALTADGNIKADTLRVGGTLQTAGDLAALIVVVDGVVDTILVDTNELQTDWVNGGRLDLILDATATASALASLVTTVGVAGAGLTEAGGTGDHLTALAQASVCTEGRLAELDAANLPADIDTIKADGPNKPTRGVQLSNLPFLMVDETDFATPETGVTVTATISKDGGAFSACANAAAEIGNGVYKITLTSGEMTADVVVLKFTGTGCAQTTMALATQPT